MSRQYGRVYELIITTADGEVRVITDLRIDFEITKSVISIPNLARLTLYNPNQDTLAALQRKFTSVVLNAGYAGNVKTLFLGDVKNVFQPRTSTDTMATVYCGDGFKSWQNSTFNKTFTGNVSISDAIKEVMSSFKGLVIGQLDGLPSGADKLRGQSLSGQSKDILDQYAGEYGFNWSIQDGEIITTPIDKALIGLEAVVISSTTGMINSPTVTEIGADVTTLLNPSLLPNSSFIIQSSNAEIAIGNLFFRDVKRTTAEGFYKVQEVTFKGNSRGAEWTSSVKGRLISGL